MTLIPLGAFIKDIPSKGGRGGFVNWGQVGGEGSDDFWTSKIDYLSKKSSKYAALRKSCIEATQAKEIYIARERLKLVTIDNKKDEILQTAVFDHFYHGSKRHLHEFLLRAYKSAYPSKTHLTCDLEVKKIWDSAKKEQNFLELVKSETSKLKLIADQKKKTALELWIKVIEIKLVTDGCPSKNFDFN